MRALVIYFSFTGQAELVANRIGEVLRKGGHFAELGRVSFASPTEPTSAPVPFSVVGRWGNDAKKSIDVPISLSPEAAFSDSYDIIFLLSNTWSFTTCAPIQTFLRSPAASVLKGRPVAIGIVCRGFWKGNLAKVKQLLGEAQGNYTVSEVFNHAGAWLTSTITNVFGMTKPAPLPTRFGPLKLPPFGVTPESIAKIPSFVQRAIAAVKT